MSIKDTNKTSENILDNLKKSFSDIVSQYSEPLYWKIRHIVLNHDDANDILQNVFIKAWKNIDDFQNRAKISTWLYRIAINESLDFIRKQNPLLLLNPMRTIILRTDLLQMNILMEINGSNATASHSDIA